MSDSQRPVKVTVTLDDGISAIKRTFHHTERVMINGIYHVPGGAMNGMSFEISFAARFDYDKGSVYSEEVLASEIDGVDPKTGLYDIGVLYPAAPAESVKNATDEGKGDVFHSYCCDENTALCGYDISGEPETDGDGYGEVHCTVCEEKYDQDVGCGPNCTYMEDYVMTILEKDEM